VLFIFLQPPSATLSSFPANTASLVTLAAGYLFGLWFGFLFAYTGCCLGSVIAFLLGRTLFRSWVSSLARQYPKVALMDQAIGKKAVGWKIVLLLRLSPMLPYNILNYVLSVTRVRFMDYFLFSVVGMFPGIALFAYLGSLSHDLSSLFSFTSERMDRVSDGDHTALLFYSCFIFSLFVLLSYYSAQAIKKELKKIEDESTQKETDKDLDRLEMQQLHHEDKLNMSTQNEQLPHRKEDDKSEPASCNAAILNERFEQNRSCGMRKNLSWVDASLA
jgi:uncharacterized membrane protein YdjX (TVP38/TMEM64 family)